MFAIAADRSTGACILRWREGGATYDLRLERSDRTTRSEMQGDEGTVATYYSVRFSLIHASSRRVPFPAFIEFSATPFPLVLRRVQGPQHGAQVNQAYSFVK
jgi:hypothetical protein